MLVEREIAGVREAHLALGTNDLSLSAPGPCRNGAGRNRPDVEGPRSTLAIVEGYGSSVTPEEREVLERAIERVTEHALRSSEQDARYREFRALLESDPDWVDGEFIQV
jgi:hypothetical protein